MPYFSLLLTAAEGGQTTNTTLAMILQLAPLLLIFVVLYFIMIRPQKKKEKQAQEMRNNVQIGDEITTIGGIMGRVVAIKDDEDAIIIETGSDRVKMKFKKWYVSTVDTVKEAPAKEKSSEKEEKAEKKGLFGKKKKDEEDK